MESPEVIFDLFGSSLGASFVEADKEIRSFCSSPDEEKMRVSGAVRVSFVDCVLADNKS